MRADDAINEAASLLAAAAIDEHRREAAGLLAHVLDRDRTFLFAHPEYDLTESELQRYNAAIDRRRTHEPYHYIIGIKEFYGLEFRVAPGVLIPRPETELLVDEAVAVLQRSGPEPRFVEIGAGSGCISVAVVKNVEGARALCVDISEEALAIARSNAERHGVLDRVDFRFSDVYEHVDGEFPLIVSNPPYIPETDRESLAQDVVAFEPESALFGGSDGLSVIRRITDDAPKRLLPGGTLAMEIGAGQARLVERLMEEVGFANIEFRRDLQGIERVAVATCQNSCF